MKNHRSKFRLGVFVLFASWLAGSLVANAQLSPAITTQPQSQNTTNGNNVTFSVDAKGHPRLRYQWRFNTVPVNGATNSTFVLINLQCSDAGSYSVVVTNDFGSITSTEAVLTVIDTVAPVIICPTTIQVQSFAEVPPPDASSVIATDSCSSVIVTNLGDSYFTNGADVNVSRLWRATDGAGNATQCVQTIVINSNCVPPHVTFFQYQRQRLETGYLATADIVVTGTSPFRFFTCLGNLCTNFVSFSTSFHIGPLFEPFEDNGPVQGLFVTNRCGGTGGIIAGAVVFALSRGNPSVQVNAPGAFAGPVLTTPCGVLGTNSLWRNFIAADEGVGDISTEGTPEDTIMGVYTGSISSVSSLHLIACNNDVSPTIKQSRLQFQAHTNIRYYLAIDGVRTQATFRLSYGFEPRLEIRRLGNPVTFELLGSPAPSLSYSLQASTNLTNWTTLANTNFAPLATNSSSTTNTVFYFQDTTIPSLPRRFYRIVPGE